MKRAEIGPAFSVSFRAAPRVASLTRRLWASRAAYLFLLPSLVGLTVFLLYPMLQAVLLSFFDAKLRDQEFVGLENYARFANDPVAHAAIRNTLLFVVGIVPATVLISLVLAVTIESYVPRLQSVYRAAFYLPVVAGAVVLAVVWKWIYNPAYGLLTWLLGLVGIKSPVFLGSPDTALWALSVVAITYNVGPPLLLYLAALGAIPSELRDAARIDGANERQVFRYIIVPLLRPTTLFVTVITTIVVLQIWDIIQIMTLGGPAYGTITLGYMVYTSAFLYGQFGYASTIAVVLMGIVLLAVAIQFHLARERRTK